MLNTNTINIDKETLNKLYMLLDAIEQQNEEKEYFENFKESVLNNPFNISIQSTKGLRGAYRFPYRVTISNNRMHATFDYDGISDTILIENFVKGVSYHGIELSFYNNEAFNYRKKRDTYLNLNKVIVHNDLLDYTQFLSKCLSLPIDLYKYNYTIRLKEVFE